MQNLATLAHKYMPVAAPLLVGILLLIGGIAIGHAAAVTHSMVARNGGDSLTITDSPCVDPRVKVAIVKMGLHPEDFHAARALISGRKWIACWVAVVSQGSVGIVYEDGDSQLVPIRVFERPDAPAPGTF